MSWLGDLVGEIAGALFPGARAIVTKAVNRAVDAVVSAGRKFVESWLSDAEQKGTLRPDIAAREQRHAAQELAAEEKYLAEKYLRDGRRSPADADRIEELNVEREKLGSLIGETNAVRAAQEIATTQGLISAPATPDEWASQIGILSTKPCKCGGTMTLRLGNYDIKAGQKFLWHCTAMRQFPCKDEYVSLTELSTQVSVRRPNADLDISPAERQSWNNPNLVGKTAARVRGHLGVDDEAILCPIHLLPMKLLPMANAGGLLLDSYQYTCLGVHPDGRACSQTLPLKSFGQVSGLLTRLEGQGIL